MPDGAAVALIRRGKSDPFGDGRQGYLPARSADLVRAWLDASGIKGGWLFRRVTAGRVGADALHPHSVGRILKQRARAAGLAPEIVGKISGHSMRVGAAQDMMLAGLDLLPIMRVGGWTSTAVVARYVSEVDIRKVAALRP